MEEIKTTIEVGGIKFETTPSGNVRIERSIPFYASRKLYNKHFTELSVAVHTCGESDILYIDSDDPWKLHKFTGAKYEGLVDRPKDVFKVMEEFVKKFDGCTIIYSAHQVAIHGKRLHSIRDKSVLFWSLSTSKGEDFAGKVRVCRISHPHLEDVDLSYVKKNASEIISEFTRIMKDEDNA